MDTTSNNRKTDKSNGGKSNQSNRSNRSNKSNRSKQASVQIESEDISLSQLELMANKKKLNKKSEVSVSELVTKDKEPNKPQSSPGPNRQKTKSSSSIGTISSDTKSEDRKKRDARKVQRENNNDYIRKEKVEFLYKLDKLAQRGRARAVKLDMNNSLDEIRNEYERISNDMKTERSVAFFKRMLLLGVQGVEMLNNTFDPMGVDLDGWSEAMGYSLENQEYDEVMAELYEKYKGSGQMSPEVKLIFMIISSATMFTISKKITKLDSSNVFKNIIGNIVGKQQNASSGPQTQFNVDPQQYQEAQQFQQQYNQQYQQQYQQQYNQQQQATGIPTPNDLRNETIITETTDDPRPSKIKGPAVNSDGIDINNILKTMNERKREKDLQERNIIETENSDDLFKSIPLNTQKRGRGRPKKAAAITKS